MRERSQYIQQAIDAPRLTREQEAALGQRIRAGTIDGALTPDAQEARKMLVEGNRHIAAFEAVAVANGRDDVEDIYHECVTALIRAALAWDARRAFGTYAAKAARNAARDYLYCRANPWPDEDIPRRPARTQIEDVPDTGDSVEDIALANVMAEQMREAAGRVLTVRQKRVFDLMMDGFAVEDIAAELGKDHGPVSRMVARIEERLAAEIGE